jgi:hypothetical protein
MAGVKALAARRRAVWRGRDEAMITGDSITTDQLREVWYAALDRGDRALVRLALIALGAGEWFASEQERTAARDQCAKTLPDLPHAWMARDDDFTPACAVCDGFPRADVHV